MKKGFLSLSALLSIVLVCGSCGTGKENNSEVSNETSVSEEISIAGVPELDTNRDISITFYHTMNQTLNEVLDHYVEAGFTSKYPNIKVTTVSAGGYDDVCDQLATSIAAGKTVCDMAYCYPDHVAKYNRAGFVAPLDKYINHEEYGFTQDEIDDFNQAYWNEGCAFGDGLMYSLPFSKSTEVMYYDKDFFEENDLEVPDHWFSNDENDVSSVEYVCEKILDIDPTCIPLGYDSEANWFITLCEQLNSPYTSATGEHFIFDNQVNRDFITKLKGWYDKGYFTTKTIYNQYTSNLFKNQDKTTSRCYMCVGSSAGASNQVPDGFAFEVGIAKLPQMDINNPKVISQGPNICIFKNQKDPQIELACWLLLRFLTTSVQLQADFSINSGYTPVINSVYENEIYLENLASADGGEGIAAYSTSIAIEESDWYFTSPAFVGSSEARSQVGTLFNSVMLGTLSVADAFKDAIDTLNALI